jgi:hypothetical protein
MRQSVSRSLAPPRGGGPAHVREGFKVDGALVGIGGIGHVPPTRATGGRMDRAVQRPPRL